MSSTLLLFYGVFLLQIFIISIYFPMRIRKRILYVLKKCPPGDYPKLYPKPYDYNAEEAGNKGLKTYRNINLAIGAVGLAILVWAYTSGYSPSPLGGDEIFVIFYFMLQASPLFFLEIGSLKQFKRMREANAGAPGKAELYPRHLFDFISPIFVVLAVLLYIGWMVYFIYNTGFDAPWRWEVYVTIGGVTLMNLIFVGMISKFMLGKKINPYQSNKDRLKHIETIVKACVITSIGATLFIFLSDFADRFEFELYDPVFMSVYLQLVLTVSLGFEFKTIKVEAIDFDVYKKDKPAAST